MRWRKKGLILEPDTDKWWSQKYCILPTPIHLQDKSVVRIYFSTACKENFGRITFIDLDENDLSKIVFNPNRYVLDIGAVGTFDDCGVIPSSIVQTKNHWRLYYSGFQRHFRVPFSILTGLSQSDNGIDFQRNSNTPILERTATELNIRSSPTVFFEQGVYKMFYVSSFGWENIPGPVHNDKFMPTYYLMYSESTDGIKWEEPSGPVIKLESDEFGFGRPWIFKDEQKNMFQLYYSIRRRSKSYRIGYAESQNGKTWERKDNEIGIDVSENGWDSEMICYPAVIKVKDRTFMFYNGNNNGATGFGYAELIEN